MSNCEYRTADIKDLDGIVNCHIKAFPGRFQTEMGFKWLTCLYRYYIQHDQGIVVIAVEQKEVLGFCIGGKPDISSDFFNKAVFKYMPSLLFNFLTKSIVRKTLIAEALKRMKSFIGPKKNAHSTVPPANTYGELLSIAVLPECKGKGIASGLLSEFVKSAPQNYYTMRLTVLAENSRAIAFYEKYGWYEVQRIEKSIKFHCDLDKFD